jgi:hypothetical protein
MAAHQRLERVTIARLRRRDKEPITGLDYHRDAESLETRSLAWTTTAWPQSHETQLPGGRNAQARDV